MINLDSADLKFPEPAAPYALVAITLHGCRLASKITEKFPKADFYCPEKFQNFAGTTVSANRIYSGSVKKLIEHLFSHYEGIIAIVSLGAMIRLVAPHLKDKTLDPAVVVIDEKGEFVISVLSGHIGGANELARTLAAKIGGRPVITTASDIQQTISADLIGKEFGWIMEPCEYLTEISAAIVNEESVIVIQESGETSWLPEPLPSNIQLYHNIEDIIDTNTEYYIIITHRDISAHGLLQSKKCLVYRPKVIGLGIGCNRGTSATEIHDVVIQTLSEIKFDKKSVHGVASIDIKQDEPGLLEFCKIMDWKIFFYPVEELNRVELESPSETVFKHIGAYGVSEPAAKLYTRNDQLELVKKVSGNVTISVGVICF